MAEAIGIVSGLIAISDAGFKISKVLYKLGKSLVKAKDQINGLVRELSNISSAFECLADALKASEGAIETCAIRHDRSHPSGLRADVRRNRKEFGDYRETGSEGEGSSTMAVQEDEGQAVEVEVGVCEGDIEFDDKYFESERWD